MLDPKHIIPRNGHLVVRMARSADAIIILDKTTADRDVEIVIAAVAPDTATLPRSNELAFRVGDRVLVSDPQQLPTHRQGLRLPPCERGTRHRA